MSEFAKLEVVPSESIQGAVKTYATLWGPRDNPPSPGTYYLVPTEREAQVVALVEAIKVVITESDRNTVAYRKLHAALAPFEQDA